VLLCVTESQSVIVVVFCDIFYPVLVLCHIMLCLVPRVVVGENYCLWLSCTRAGFDINFTLYTLWK